MSPATPETIRSCHAAFLSATSKHALSNVGCCSCAREVPESSATWTDISTVPNSHLLNRDGLPDHAYTAGKLVLEKSLITTDDTNSKSAGYFCAECIKALRDDKKTPKHALAHGLWIDHIPSELSDLTLPEQLLIGLTFPRVYVCKLFPRDRPQGVKPEHMQRGMQGNVISFPRNIDKVVDMLDGKLMPQPPSVLASVIAVSYIGSGRLPKWWLNRTFRVRRHRVREVLIWLKTNNPLYADIKICAERLKSLPEDNVPVEITINVRHSENTEASEREQATYVPDDSMIFESEAREDEVAQLSLRDVMASSHSVDDEDEGDTLNQVVPLRTIGVDNTDITGLSMNRTLLHALATGAENREGGYAVRYGKNAVTDFGVPLPGEHEPRINPMAAAYPCLFPFGVGAPEMPEVRHLSFDDHIRWCLGYHDRRFRVHESFIYHAYGVQQKRQALASARVQSKRADFDKLCNLRMTSHELEAAQKQEESNQAITNPRVLLLRRHVWTTSGRVEGTDSSRALNRSKMWGTSLYMNPVSLWVTINPNDLHDPIVQVLAGDKDIDMDKFDPTAGPNADERASNVAKDPFAAASFFNLVINIILRDVLGVKKSRFKVESCPGIFGRVSAYFGVVEAQGRGTLHLHLLVWLVGAPTSDRMRQLLTEATFRQQVANYIRHTIRAHLDRMSEADVTAMPRKSDVAYSRPPNPASNDYETIRDQLEREVVRSSQVHVCKRTTCLVPSRGLTWKCKRGAPFATAAVDGVDEKGNWTVKRSNPYLNNWCPSLIGLIRVNHDIKLVTNGRDTMSLAWYLTGYATKGQQRTYNASALLANAVAKHELDDSYMHDIRERGRKLMFKCWNELNSKSEASGQQVVMRLMGWGDTYESHQYVPLFWSSFVAYIKSEDAILRGM